MLLISNLKAHLTTRSSCRFNFVQRHGVRVCIIWWVGLPGWSRQLFPRAFYPASPVMEKNTLPVRFSTSAARKHGSGSAPGSYVEDLPASQVFGSISQMVVPSVGRTNRKRAVPQEGFLHAQRGGEI